MSDPSDVSAARLANIRGSLAEARSGLVGRCRTWEGRSYQRMALDLLAAVDAAATENARLRAALEFYATEGGDAPVVSVDIADPTGIPGCRLIIDRGQRARAALAASPPPEPKSCE